jgi:hypothetical protein
MGAVALLILALNAAMSYAARSALRAALPTKIRYAVLFDVWLVSVAGSLALVVWGHLGFGADLPDWYAHAALGMFFMAAALAPSLTGLLLRWLGEANRCNHLNKPCTS